MRDTERGKEVGDRYEVLILGLLPPIYMIWSDRSVNLVYYWTCLTIRKRKGKKKKDLQRKLYGSHKGHIWGPGSIF